MLDKMAEMVREDKSVLCDLCPYIPNEADCINAMVCPSIADIPEDRLARWVVLLVARALETLPDAKEQDLRQLKSGKKLEDRSKTEQAEYVCAMSNLGIDFMNLLSDATISAREAKEAEHE